MIRRLEALEAAATFGVRIDPLFGLPGALVQSRRKVSAPPCKAHSEESKPVFSWGRWRPYDPTW